MDQAEEVRFSFRSELAHRTLFLRPTLITLLFLAACSLGCHAKPGVQTHGSELAARMAVALHLLKTDKTVLMRPCVAFKAVRF